MRHLGLNDALIGEMCLGFARDWRRVIQF